MIVRDQIGAPAAAIASLILAIHPSYLAMTIYDQGGVTGEHSAQVVQLSAQVGQPLLVR